MPTAGKVLTILLIPVTIAWLILASMATQRNRNWGKKVQELDSQIEALVGTAEKPGEIAQLRAQVEQLNNKIVSQMAQTTRDSTTLRSRLSQIESTVALTREDLARLQFLVQDTERQVESARQIAERRTQEKADTEKEIGTAKDQLADLTQEDAKLRERRESLVREFQAVLAENRQLVQRLLKASNSSN
jgi:chromosome segregation ATPase